ncbi:CheR family methyltransferase [Faucicola boevrei]|uniref:CheR family methyltransferase n=1 Tax=Faucicola boevrei TaxID=346665 RepID=UPI0003708869|nr:CheR family methyltransferase [Moraxella boevrei]
MQSHRITPNELGLWLKYIEHQVGFVLPDAQVNWVKIVIERHLAKHALTSTQFLEKLALDKEVYHCLFDDILIPRTQFFRHQSSFNFLAQYTKAWANAYQAISMPFTVWSVGCSTGQEPVSLLLNLAQELLQHNGREFLVYGSDFRQQSLEIAKQGLYDKAELADIPTFYHDKLQIFDKKFGVLPEYRRHLQFFSKNLVDKSAFIPLAKRQCQIIVCKNVLIYFRQFEKRDILQYLTQFLADDGVLLLGVGELTKIQQSELVHLPLANVNVFCKKNAPMWVQQLTLTS